MNTDSIERDWKDFVSDNSITSIPVPYSFLLGALNIVGILYLRDPLKESTTKGSVVGAIIGDYELNKDDGEASLYDPTGQLLRFVINLDLTGLGELKARIDTRRWDGKWNKGTWMIIWRG